MRLISGSPLQVFNTVCEMRSDKSVQILLVLSEAEQDLRKIVKKRFSPKIVIMDKEKLDEKKSYDILWIITSSPTLEQLQNTDFCVIEDEYLTHRNSKNLIEFRNCKAIIHIDSIERRNNVVHYARMYSYYGSVFIVLVFIIALLSEWLWV